MRDERRFLDLYPDSVYLSVDNTANINDLLNHHGVLSYEEQIQYLSLAGEGNMNCVLRASTNYRSLIIKQSRPWVAKYPQIPAPIERVNVEGEFIKVTSSSRELCEYSPTIIAHLPSHFLLILEDFGQAADFSDLFQGSEISREDLYSLQSYLDALHNFEVHSFPINMEMRKLNHEHIFHLPFQENNGLDLDNIDQGLADLASTVISKRELIKRIENLGRLYLDTDYNSLIHGDYYPASFLRTESGLKVIDAEFAFMGPKEFDWAVLLAHLILSSQSSSNISFWISAFEARNNIENGLVFQFAGVEILRRLLGVAQLPLKATIDLKKEWVNRAINFIKNSSE